MVEAKVKWCKKRKMEREYCYFAVSIDLEVVFSVWFNSAAVCSTPLTDLLLNCVYVSLNQTLIKFSGNVSYSAFVKVWSHLPLYSDILQVKCQ